MTAGTASIERLAGLLVVVVTGSLLAAGLTRLGLGVAAGGAFSVLNFYLLRRLAAALLAAVHVSRQWVLGLMMASKLAVVGVAIYVLIRHLRVDALGMLLGVSLVVVAILFGGFRAAMTAGGQAHPENE